jgi:2-iminobutanoate/2-iminopropanoate deaminase
MPDVKRVSTPFTYASAVAAGEYVFLGLALERLVKVNVWLEDIEDLPEMEKRFADYFEEGAYPARMTSTTEFIDDDCMMMIDGIAYRGGR